MNAPAAHPQSAEILAALPLRVRPGLYIQPEPDVRGNLTVLDRDDDHDDSAAEAIVGLAIRDQCGWYLGCIDCRAEIEEADGGMCRPCREELARKDLVHIRDEPEEPLPGADREDYGMDDR